MMATAVRTGLFALLVWFPAIHWAAAEVAQFHYEAVVTSVDLPGGHPLEGRLAPGDVISGRLQYDLALGDYLDAVPTVGIYEALPAGLNRASAASGNGFTFDSTLVARPAFSATVDDGSYSDILLVRYSGDTMPSTLERPDTQFVEMAFLLETTNTRLFSSDDLPDRLALQDFELAGIDFFGTGSTFPTFLVNTSIISLETMPPMLPGDFSGNGLIDQSDLDLTLVHWGETATPVPPTWIGLPPEGIIDQTELDYVLASWGAVSARSTAIPEPGTLALVTLIGAIALCGKFLRRRP